MKNIFVQFFVAIVKHEHVQFNPSVRKIHICFAVLSDVKQAHRVGSEQKQIRLSENELIEFVDRNWEDWS